ncbi:MAG: glycoside hydrolase family 43 protein [Chitinispirillia bacterium]|jgi:xylan 1,4-beta-xylosidase
MRTIKNPILPGFHPDPSICRRGDDYYIATSTFEWYPGVRIHHSRDLIHWKFIGYVLTRPSQLDMIGNIDSAGIWAPCLSYKNGLFYCIFTNTRSYVRPYDDIDNYLVTSKTIEGPWSEPVYLNSSGFDPSLFHDDDGKKWLVNMLWDHRAGVNHFAGILLQEYSPSQKQLIGKIFNIYKGTELGITEGPHIYKKDGWYYLCVAEGGTSWGHAVTIARSKNISGPYETHPDNPILTSRYDPTLALQKAGHSSFVETQNGEWYAAHLCGRPIMPERRCILGRETALQKLIWEQGEWPRLASGGKTPELETPAPDLPQHPFEIHSKNSYKRDDFNSETIDPEFNSLRHPINPSWCNLSKRPGFLRLYGRESLYSKHYQSLIAKRITHLNTEASTAIEFHPECFQHMAGLVFFYNTTNHHYLYVTWHNNRKWLSILSCDRGKFFERPEAKIPVTADTVYLRGDMRGRELQFFYATEPDKWIPIGRLLDASILSDEYFPDIGKFTGAFVGICVQDLAGRKIHADFDWFSMQVISDS